MSATQLIDHRLNAFTLRLTLSPARRFDVAGAAAQALVLRLVELGDPQLGARLRKHAAARPYTVASLPDSQTPTQVVLRVSAVGTGIQAAIEEAVGAYNRSPSIEPLALGPTIVAGIDLETAPCASPWVGASSLLELHRTAGRLDDELTVLLSSPTLPWRRPVSWRSGPPSEDVLTPQHLFAAMHERWRALGRFTLAPPYDAVLAAAAHTRILHAQLTVSAHLRSKAASPAGEPITGFTGLLSLRLEGSRAERMLLQTLAAASFYLGAGIGTASGMGLVRIIPGAVEPL